VGAVKRAAADRPGGVRRANLFVPFEVGDGAAHLEDAVAGAGGEALGSKR